MTLPFRLAGQQLYMVALFWLLACAGSTSATTKVIVATQLSPSAVRVGDTIRVVTSVTNVTLTTATLETSTCDAPFEVLDTQGNVVGPGFDHSCPSGSAPLLLQAGIPYDLPGFYTGLATASTSGNKVFLPAGTYRIRGKAKVAELGTIHGPAVEFRITP